MFNVYIRAGEGAIVYPTKAKRQNPFHKKINALLSKSTQYFNNYQGKHLGMYYSNSHKHLCNLQRL